MGGDLNIESTQDTSAFKSKQKSAGFSVSVPIGAGGFAASVNASKGNVESEFKSVIEQSGIKAGDEGFDVTVQGNTNLKGAVIASNQTAIQNNKNKLTTGTLTTSSLKNKATFNASSTGIGLGYSTPQGGGVGKNQDGDATSGSSQIPGSLLSGLDGFSATPPVALSSEGDDRSTTLSGISTGTITITDEEKQQSLTGQDADTTVASINREVDSDKDTSNALAPIFDEQQLQADFEITRALSQEVGTFLNNRARESAQAQEALELEQAKPENEQDLQRIAQLIGTIRDNATFEVGGTGRRIITAITAAVSGDATTGSAILQSAAVNYLQSLAVTEVKKIADALNSESARVALQSIVGCAGAAAQGQACRAGATGAAAGVVLNNVLDGLAGVEGNALTAEDKQQRVNIVNSLVVGIANAGGEDVSTALSAATIVAENNDLVFVPPEEVVGPIGNTALSEKSSELLLRDGKTDQPDLINRIARDTTRPVEERIEQINRLLSESPILSALDFDVTLNQQGELVLTGSINNFFEESTIASTLQRDAFKAQFIDTLDDDGRPKDFARVFFTFFNTLAGGAEAAFNAVRKNPDILVNAAIGFETVINDLVVATGKTGSTGEPPTPQEIRQARARTFERLKGVVKDAVALGEKFESAAATGDLETAGAIIITSIGGPGRFSKNLSIKKSDNLTLSKKNDDIVDSASLGEGRNTSRSFDTGGPTTTRPSGVGGV